MWSPNTPLRKASQPTTGDIEIPEMPFFHRNPITHISTQNIIAREVLTKSPTPTATQAPPALSPSVEEAYRRKCIQLKARLNEVQAANDVKRAKLLRMNRGIDKLRLERVVLLEALNKRTSTNVEDSDGSPSPPPTVCHPDTGSAIQNHLLGSMQCDVLTFIFYSPKKNPFASSAAIVSLPSSRTPMLFPAAPSSNKPSHSPPADPMPFLTQTIPSHPSYKLLLSSLSCYPATVSPLPIPLLHHLRSPGVHSRYSATSSVSRLTGRMPQSQREHSHNNGRP